MSITIQELTFHAHTDRLCRRLHRNCEGQSHNYHRHNHPDKRSWKIVLNIRKKDAAPVHALQPITNEFKSRNAHP